jgi:hypothetical protein
MDNLPLEYFVNIIDESLKRNATAFNDALAQKHADFKVRALCEVTGDLSGQLAYLKDVFEKEMKIRKSKKFWQFWK